MSDDEKINVTEFKEPTMRVGVDDETSDKLHEECLNFWDKLNKEMIAGEGKEYSLNSQCEVLTGILSTYVGFLNVAYGSKNTVNFLNEILRRIRMSEDYKKSLQ